jgi:hypothetical protein
MTLRELAQNAPDTLALSRAEIRPATDEDLRNGLCFVLGLENIRKLEPHIQHREGVGWIATFMDEQGPLEVMQEGVINGRLTYGHLRIRRRGRHCWRNFETLAQLNAALECMTDLPF